MLYTIYAAKFEQTIIYQHVHLRRESQSHAPAHVLMRLYPIDKSLVSLQKGKKDVMLEYFINSDKKSNYFGHNSIYMYLTCILT